MIGNTQQHTQQHTTRRTQQEQQQPSKPAWTCSKYAFMSLSCNTPLISSRMCLGCNTCTCLPTGDRICTVQAVSHVMNATHMMHHIHVTDMSSNTHTHTHMFPSRVASIPPHSHPRSHPRQEHVPDQMDPLLRSDVHEKRIVRSMACVSVMLVCVSLSVRICT